MCIAKALAYILFLSKAANTLCCIACVVQGVTKHEIINDRSIHTYMAVTLSGNVLAMIAKLDVTRAAAPRASTTRTIRHITANGTPSGLPSVNLPYTPQQPRTLNKTNMSRTLHPGNYVLVTGD